MATHIASARTATAPQRPGRGLLNATAVAAAAERLAAPSTVVASVLELIDGGSAPVRAVAGRVAQSPEISVQVLRLANSALFGDPVDTLDRAIVRIGERSLRGLLLAASTYRLLEGELRVFGLPRLALFRHSNEVAAAAQGVATRLSAGVAPQAFLAGLVHDIGKPILNEVARGHEGLPTVRGVEQERAVFGTDHARVGTWIAKRWSLPEDICEAMEHHHAPQPPDTPVGRAVWLADILVRSQAGEADALARLADAGRAVGLAAEDLEDMLATATHPEGEAPLQRPSGLTDRELQVLRMLATGAAAKQVALQLGCSVSTVHNHLHHVYRKLNVTGQAQALLMAREMGWV
jgi:putative nucleotidyltransferase with HDIG domain